MTAPRFAVGVPNIGPFGDPRDLVELAERAEAAGWDGFFVWDHLLWRDPGEPVADPVVTIAAAAARTERLRLGVLVTNLARRRPQKVAKEYATLDVLSGGRAVLGAGLGSFAEEWERFGEDPDPKVRAARLDEGLEVVTRLWSGQPVSHDGAHHVVRGAQMRPAPRQHPRIPVWIGGSWPHRAPFRRAARWDGVMPTAVDHRPGSTMPPETLAEIVAFVARHRPGDTTFDVALEGATDPRSPRRARSMVDAYRAAGLTWWVEAFGWWRGPLAETATRISAGPPGDA